MVGSVYLGIERTFEMNRREMMAAVGATTVAGIVGIPPVTSNDRPLHTLFLSKDQWKWEAVTRMKGSEEVGFDFLVSKAEIGGVRVWQYSTIEEWKEWLLRDIPDSKGK